MPALFSLLIFSLLLTQPAWSAGPLLSGSGIIYQNENNACYFQDWSYFTGLTGLESSAGLAREDNLPKSVLMNGPCQPSNRFFLVGSTIYYENSSSHYCGFPDWETFAAMSGKNSAAGLPAFDATPLSATYDGACTIPSGSQLTSVNSFKLVDAQNDGFAYSYGPTIIYTQGTYHAYFCSKGNGGSSWDYIRHITSNDLVNWSQPAILLQPSPYEQSNCDPSIVRFNAGDGLYYYLFYSGAVLNIGTVNFVARSASPNGPFLKYTARGTWEQSPADPQMITGPFRGSASDYGAGEASVVVSGGVLHMWYSDDSNPAAPGARVYSTTSLDAVHWTAPILTTVSDFSVDVKYDSVHNQYVMMEVTPQLSTTSVLQVRTSIDGLNWSAANVLCGIGCMQQFSSNVGFEGDDQGHVINLSEVLVGFGAPYYLGATSSIWGEWDLWGQFYNLSNSLPTPP